LYVSEGEPFIPQNNTSPGVSSLASKLKKQTLNQNKEWITLNVGGKYFTTSLSTLVSKEPTSMLAR